MTDEERREKAKKELETIEAWSKDVFKFAYEALGMRPAVPIDDLLGQEFIYEDAMGNKQRTYLFSETGELLHKNLGFYKQSMFKHQTVEAFKMYRGKRFTWQQTLSLTAYQRAIDTFDRDSYLEALRWISIVSGHGTGKTSFLCVVALHFLISFFGAQIGVTANTENQLKDIFLKEIYFWYKRLPDFLQEQIEIQDDMVRIKGENDWFLRARVARPEKPEAMAGLHGKHVLLIFDEASAISDKILEVARGALTGENYIVLFTSNGTRAEGFFYESQKPGSNYTRLSYSCRHSPIVKPGFIESIENEYGKESDEVAIRVDGGFPASAQMDDKGWIPLFANVHIMFEPENNQIIRFPIFSLDPAGQGRDRAIGHVRDHVYLKEVLNENVSTPKNLARSVEVIRDAYNIQDGDIGIEAFGIGAEVVANVNTKIGESVNALLTDQPREETKHLFNSYKSELAWKFRNWLINGGIIITNNPKDWMREFEKIKFKRDLQGRISLMPKVLFKKEYGFSPDRFDAAIHTMFKDTGTMPVVMTKQEVVNNELQEWIARQQQRKVEAEIGIADEESFSSM